MILTLVGVGYGTLYEAARRARGVGADIVVRPPGATTIAARSAPMNDDLLPFFMNEFVQFVHGIRGAFSDIKLVVEDILGAGDKVVVRWSAKMTHTETLRALLQLTEPLAVEGLVLRELQKARLSGAGTAGISSERWASGRLHSARRGFLAKSG